MAQRKVREVGEVVTVQLWNRQVVGTIQSYRQVTIRRRRLEYYTRTIYTVLPDDPNEEMIDCLATDFRKG